MSGPTPHLLKRWNCALQPELNEHTFFDFHEKRKQVHGKFNAHAILSIPIYRSIKCTSKPQFQNDVKHFPYCKSHIEINVLKSALFLFNEQRQARIVGLIQINDLFILSGRSLLVIRPPAVLHLVEWS